MTENQARAGFAIAVVLACVGYPLALFGRGQLASAAIFVAICCSVGTLIVWTRQEHRKAAVEAKGEDDVPVSDMQ